MTITASHVRKAELAEWLHYDPVLPEGDIAVVKDTGNFKIGDGTSKWSRLSFRGSKDVDVQTEINSAIDDLIAGAPGALDTLKELSDRLEDNEDAAAALVNLVAEKPDFSDLDEKLGVDDAASTYATQSALSTGLASKASTSDLSTGLATKADDAATTAALAAKVSTADMNIALATKADDVATTAALATKASTTALTNGLSTKADDAATTAALATKASTAALTAGLATKADDAATTAALATKADASATTAALATKASTTALTTGLATKADDAATTAALATKATTAALTVVSDVANDGYARATQALTRVPPAGGAINKILKKASAADYDFVWADDNAGSAGSVNTVGFGLPTTAGRTAGDHHYDTLTMRDYVLSSGAWVTTTGSTNTQGAGLPGFAGRTASDHHFDTTAGREYILTGAVGSSYADDFSSGSLAAYSTYGGIGISGGRVTLTDASNRPGGIFRSLGAGITHEAAADIVVGASVANLNSIGVTTKKTAGTNDGTGYAFYLESATSYRLARNGSSNGAMVYAGPNALNSTKRLAIVATAAGSVKCYVDGSLVLTYTDGAPLTGSFAGAAINETDSTTALLDNLVLVTPGTLAWTQTQP